METPVWRFSDRQEAGELLADRLERFAGRPDVLVLALPPHGIAVAVSIAHSLHLPMDVLVVQAIGVPWNPEFTIGSLTSGGTMILDEGLMRSLLLTRQSLASVIERETRELWRREAMYRERRPFPALGGKTVIVVDDGIRSGARMQSAVRTIRARDAARIVVAVPVVPRNACADLATIADRVETLMMPDTGSGVDMWYHDFSSPTDAEILDLLAPGAGMTFASTV
jgi:predicted phosphoribosyltransferase